MFPAALGTRKEMSRADVEVVRQVFDAAHAHEWESVLAGYSPEIEWDDRDLRPDGGVHVGKDAIRAQMRAWVGTWSNYRQDAEQIVDAGDRVVVVLREAGEAKGSGAPMRHRIGLVLTVRDGLIVQQTVYRHPEEALEAVGLRE